MKPGDWLGRIIASFSFPCFDIDGSVAGRTSNREKANKEDLRDTG